MENISPLQYSKLRRWTFRVLAWRKSLLDEGVQGMVEAVDMDPLLKFLPHKLRGKGLCPHSNEFLRYSGVDFCIFLTRLTFPPTLSNISSNNIQHLNKAQ